MNSERKNITGRTTALAVSLLLHGIVLVGLVAVPTRGPAPEPEVMITYLAMPAAIPERALDRQANPEKEVLAKPAQAQPASPTSEKTPKVASQPVAGDAKKVAFIGNKPGLSEVIKEEGPETIRSEEKLITVQDVASRTSEPEALEVNSQFSILNSQSANAMLAFAGDPASLGMFVSDAPGPDLVKAAILSLPEPKYPVLSRKKGEEGKVIVEVTISAEGAVRRAQIKTSSSHPRLDRAALKAVQSAEFTPATDFGAPVESVMKVAYKFELEGQ